MQSIFQSSFAPIQSEIAISEQLKNSKLNLNFVAVNKASLSEKNSASKAQVKSYLASNEADVKKYYDDNSREFTIDEQVKARHILIKATDPTSFEKARKKVLEIKAQVKGSNFSELAKKHSEDKGSAVKGGDLGFFGRGKMVPSFENMAFSMKKGAVSEPVKSKFGYHIIQLEDKKGGGKTPFAKVKMGIAEKLAVKNYSKSAMDELKAIYKDSKGATLGTAVKGFIKKYKLKLVETGEFDLSQPSIPKIGDDERFIDETLKLSKNGAFLNSLIVNNGKSYIIQIKKVDLQKEAPKDVELKSQFRYGYAFQKWIEDKEKTLTVKKNSGLFTHQ